MNRYINSHFYEGIILSRPSPTAGTEDKLMAHFWRENLTILNADEVNFNQPRLLGLLVVAGMSPTAYWDVPNVFPHITRTQVKAALQEQANINIEERYISRHFGDFLVLAASPNVATTILQTTHLHIAEQRLALMPWTPGYGSFEVIFDIHFPPVENPAAPPLGVCGPYEAVRLTIVGLTTTKSDLPWRLKKMLRGGWAGGPPRLIEAWLPAQRPPRLMLTEAVIVR